jgi:hypothetical protein
LGKRDKLIEAIRRNPKNVAFEDVDNLLRYYGCKVRQKGRGSSHYKYTHPSVKWVLEIPKDKPIKAIYARRALEMIDEIREVLDIEW